MQASAVGGANTSFVSGFLRGSRAIAIILHAAVVFAFLSPDSVLQAQTTGDSGENRAVIALRHPSLAFVPNRGQSGKDVLYTAKGQGYEVELQSTRAIISLFRVQSASQRKMLPPDSTPAGSAVTMEWLNANAGAGVASSGILPQMNSFLPTGDPKTWISKVPSYERVSYSGIYPGINLAYYGREGWLEYDFSLAAGAKPGEIALALSGLDRVSIDRDGNLLLQVRGHALRLLKPAAYQLSADGAHQEVAASYRIARETRAGPAITRVTFALGRYDRHRPLVIDPVLAYGEYFSGSSPYLEAMTADPQGNVFIARAEPFSIEKLDPNGNVLLDVTVGSSFTGYPYSIAVDGSDDVYVTGTATAGLPTTAGAYELTPNSSGYNPFLSVLKADGSGLTYSTYFGGSSGSDTAYAVTVDSKGNAYVAGDGYSSNFPTSSGAYESAPSPSEGYFGFVAKFDPTLSGSASLVYSTALIAPNTDAYEYSVAVDGSGDAYVAGYSSPGFPVTPGAFAYTGYYASSPQVYVTEVNPAGTGLVYSADLGPGQANSIAVDGSGTAYVTGYVSGDDFPTTSGAYQTTYAGGFAANLSAGGSTLLYSTFLSGPSGYDSNSNFDPTSIAIPPGCSSACSASIAGHTDEADLPLTNPIQNFANTNGSAFLIELAGNGASAVYSTYLSGVTAYFYPYADSPSVPAVAVDSAGNAYLGMNLVSTADAPATIPVASPGYGYIAKIAPTSVSLALAYPTSIAFSQQPVNVSTSQYGYTLPTVNLRNLGSAPINLQTPFEFSSSQFSESDNCPAQLPAGGMCTLSLSFMPTGSGTQTGTLTINSDAPNSPVTIALSGTAVDTEYLTVTPGALSFADQVVATASSPQTVTITNVGDQPATISSSYIYSSAADYTEVNDCPASLPAGQSCQASVTFTPTQAGLRTGYLYVYSPESGYQDVSLSGTGVVGSGTSEGVLTPSSNSLNFGSLLVGTTSTSQPFYVYNTGDVPVTVSSATASTAGQTGSSDFQISSGSCGVSSAVQIDPQSYCYLYVTFTPSTAAAETGTVTINNSTSSTPLTISLSGIGLAAVQTLVASPPNYVFSAQPVGTTSSTQYIYFYNTGNDPFTIDRVLITGDFNISYTNCSEAVLDPSGPQNNYAGYCYAAVTFAPTATGMRTGTISLIDALTGNPQVFNIVGTGVAATGSLTPEPGDLVFDTQAQGTTSSIQYEYLYNTGNVPVTINSVTPAGDFAVPSQYEECTPSNPVYPGSYCYFGVNFTPMQASGAETGSATVGSTSGNLTINLSGTAEAATQAIGITPTTFNFGTTQQGTTIGYSDTPVYFLVYIRNTGTEPVTFTSAPAISGANGADFTIATDYTCSFTSSLAAGTSCYFAMNFTPSTTGAESATLALTDSAGTQTMALAGSGAAAEPAVKIYPATLAFNQQVVGTTSGLSGFDLVYFQNNGSSALTVQSATITAGSSDFVIPAGHNSCSGTSVGASGGECYVYVNFAPSVAGYRTGTLTFTDQNNQTYTVALAGYAPASVDSATLDPQALDFPPQPLNAGSNNNQDPTQYVTLTNSGNTTLTMGTLSGTDVAVGTSTTGDFSTVSGTGGYDGCSGQQIQPAGSCSVTVAFVPSTSGSKSGSITFPVTYADNTTATFTATLSGQATSDQDSASVSPSTASFPDVVAANPGSNLQSASIILSNTSNLNLKVGTLTGVDTFIGTSTSGDFIAGSTTLFGVQISGYDDCSGQTITPKSTCSVRVYFIPATTGAKTGSITFPVTFTDGTTANYTATLGGNSIAAVNTISVNPLNAQFESQIVGITDSSNYVTITVQNTGNIPVTFGTDKLSGADFTFYIDECSGQKIQPNSTCYLYVLFTPQASDTPGTITGTLTIADSATGNPHTVTLSGTALASSQQLAVSQSAVNFGNQAVSTTSNPQVVYVTNQGTNSGLTLKSVLLGGTNPTDFTEIDTCGGSSGGTLGARSSCEITVQFAPAAASTGARTATVTVTPASGAAQVIVLNGTGINPIPQATVFPTSINFGSQPLNTTTGSQYFTVTNSGSAVLNMGSVVSSDSPEFDIVSNGCTGQAVAVNASCSVSVTFTPSAGGSRGATITITDNSGGVTNTTQTVSVTGTGTGTPQATLNKESVTFPNQTVNSASTPMPVTLTNGGTGVLNIAGIVASGGSFSQTNNCGTSLAASSTCTIEVTFDPQTAGALSGNLIVTDNANGVSGSTQTATLSGTGVGIPQATLSSSSQVFSSTPVNSSVTGSAITLSNGGTGPLSITSITITGANSGDFTEQNNCGSSVSAEGQCSITVTFAPTATGARSATLTVTDNANGVTGATQTVLLSGTGLGVPLATLSTNTLSFANQAVLTTSAAQVVTLTNGGTGPLTITNIGLGGTNPGDFSDATTCTASLSSTSGSNTCTISLSFAPQAVGSLAATLVVTDNANGTAGSTQTVNLSGTGVQNTQTITFAALPSVTYGVSPIGLTATASSGLPVSYTVTGPATVSGSTLTITGTGTVKVTASQAGNSNYAAATSVSESFTVNPAVLTVTASNVSVAYNQAIPALTGYTATGFVNGDTTSVLSGTPAESTTATQGSAAGTYPITITQGTLAAANYTFTFVSGTLTISGGVPNIVAAVAAQTWSRSGVLAVTIRFTNSGSGNGSNVTLSTGVLRTLGGTGTVVFDPSSPSMPISLGTLNAGASLTETFYLDVPGTVTAFAMLETGTDQDSSGSSHSFSLEQGVIP